jgi:hypothetical protein
VYPVGSIYINAASSSNPTSLLGFGTWVEFGAGRVMVGFNASDALFDTLEETGGSKDAIVVSHTHTATSTSAVTDPGHNHKPSTEGTTGGFATSQPALPYLVSRSGVDGGPYTSINTTTSATNITVATTVASAGSSGTNANLPPYYALAYIMKA